MAEGPRGEGCPFISRLCRDTQFGCCPDGVTAAEGQFPPAQVLHLLAARHRYTQINVVLGKKKTN